MLRHKTVTTGLARPEIADGVFRQESRGFGCNHGIRADSAGRQIASARCGDVRGRMLRARRHDLSNRWHRGSPHDLSLNSPYTEILDDVATQMRWFQEMCFALQ